MDDARTMDHVLERRAWAQRQVGMISLRVRLRRLGPAMVNVGAAALGVGTTMTRFATEAARGAEDALQQLEVETMWRNA